MPADIVQLADDLRAETRELEALLSPLKEKDWELLTPAPGWAIRDQVSHLAFFDEAATLAATDADAFVRERDALLADPDGITEGVAKRSRGLSVASVHTWFREARAAMLTTFLALDPSTRVPWYGPDMSIASSLTARIMETWAHGQDIADTLGAVRTPTHALRQVAHIAARTMPNSYAARGLDVPQVPVYVELTSPNGETWTWGDATAADQVRGDALEFCLVATQRLNVADSSLRVDGPVAAEWMQIAQAFAGPPGPGRTAKTAR